MGAWAHAANTPGDPGVGRVDNTADMLTVGLRHLQSHVTPCPPGPKA